MWRCSTSGLHAYPSSTSLRTHAPAADRASEDVDTKRYLSIAERAEDAHNLRRIPLLFMQAEEGIGLFSETAST